MNLRLPLLGALVLAVALAPAAPAQQRGERARRSADRDDDGASWLERCRRDYGNDDDDRVKFCEERAMGWAARSGAALDVDAAPNGGVSVTGWDRDSVDVTVRVQAWGDDEAEARDLARRIEVVNRSGSLRATGPSGTWRHSGWVVSYVIRAPRRSDLVLSSQNGPVAVDGVTGRLRLDVQNGPLSLDAVGGDVQARAQNGPLHVTLSGTQWDGAGLDAATRNGPLVLEVPEGYNAELETGTVNGPMDIGFPITVQGQIGLGRHRHLTRGGPRIRAVTTNGPAIVRRS